jgi:NAD(P)-dependent dehydrogenase (short-subunit alcohol dehydrogenase family)
MLSGRAARVAAGRSGRSVVAHQKHVFITGGNTGIGYETAKELCRQRHEVTIACRDAAKAAKAQEAIRWLPGGPALPRRPRAGRAVATSPSDAALT